MSEPENNRRVACCPIYSHGPLRKMQHAAVPQWSFWLCLECDAVWLDVKDGEPAGERLSLWALYGDHGWPLIDEYKVIKAPGQAV